jgi:topoisomerase IV subunit A
MAKKIVSDTELPDNHDNEEGAQGDTGSKITQLSGLYENWFLEYASYVILERAVPYIEDGLKPVQRRILHSMWDLDDGRYNKVANIIGHTMKYHPHGDASIGDALVQIGQKDLLIDCQGNWGNIFTGDRAAAPRYIEARLSKFANEVVFNPKTTKWLSSYDGRNKEPETLPVKFPLLLAQGVEGIAVGLACKILPHNFIELIDASIDLLRGKKIELYPDFPTGGMADVSRYNDGYRGGKVRVRAKISKYDKNTLVIQDIPFGTNTGSLIESILNANDKGKIKIRKVEDNTAEFVEILVHLAAGISPDKTIDALYATTDCELSISPNTCVIDSDKPRFIGATEILKISTDNTVELLKRELEIRLGELEEAWHFSSLEKIFIEKRIYRDIEEQTTWEGVLEAIDKGLAKYKKLFKRAITTEDIVRLTEIRIKRISKFDSFKADEAIRNLEDEIKTVQQHLDTLVEYAIEYFKNLKKKYGKGRERKTELRQFDTIDAAAVVVNNVKLYVNREEGFAGYGLKKDEFVSDCSDIDDIIVFRADGTMLVTKISDKTFVGKDILHIGVFKKNDERTIYNMIYADGPKGFIMVKRFAVTGITRDKPYDLTKGTKGSQIIYFTANPNGEAEVITVTHKPIAKIKKLAFQFDFSTLAIKGRSALGNILTRYAVKKIEQKEAGTSTLSARQIWFDDTVWRLNADGRGRLLGSFAADDKIFIVNKDGEYYFTNFDLTNHYDDDLLIIEKFNPKRVISAVYYDAEDGYTYVKRFLPEPTEKRMLFISEADGSQLILLQTATFPRLELKFAKDKGKERENEEVDVNEFIAVKGFKAKGKRLSQYKISKVIELEPLPEPEPEVVIEPEPEPEKQRSPKDPLPDANFEADESGNLKLF